MRDGVISVVVPVYNVEPYLIECLESIINQTYRDLEIILIDDGSTDKSGDICDEYGKKDERIIVIHQNNQGSASAKNAGNIHIFNKTTMPGVTMIAMRINVQRFLNLKRSTVIQVR